MNQRLAAIGRARPSDEPIHVARPGALVRQAVRVRTGRTERDAVCEVDTSGIRVDGQMISWPDARSIFVDRGRVTVISPGGTLTMGVALDGVTEPDLAPLLARVLEGGRAGTLEPGAGALHELTLGIDRTLENFADADDPVVPLAIGAFAAVAAVVLVTALPTIVMIAARIEPAPGTFAILPRIAFFDPRVIVCAVAAAIALAVAVGRLVLGPSATAWARGTRRGWHRNSYGAEDGARQIIARLMLAPAIAALGAAVALGTLLPSAFARTVLDEQGIHEASGLPFISHDRSWAELVDVTPLAVGFAERAEGFDTQLVFSDGARLSTRGRDLVGGSERALYDLARTHAR
ncbi:MAG TPA: hypothetical protein VIN70_08730 [Candidatus Limnocylindria bacterium]